MKTIQLILVILLIFCISIASNAQSKFFDTKSQGYGLLYRYSNGYDKDILGPGIKSESFSSFGGFGARSFMSAGYNLSYITVVGYEYKKIHLEQMDLFGDFLLYRPKEKFPLGFVLGFGIAGISINGDDVTTLVKDKNKIYTFQGTSKLYGMINITKWITIIPEIETNYKYILRTRGKRIYNNQGGFTDVSYSDDVFNGIQLNGDLAVRLNLTPIFKIATGYHLKIYEIGTNYFYATALLQL